MDATDQALLDRARDIAAEEAADVAREVKMQCLELASKAESASPIVSSPEQVLGRAQAYVDFVEGTEK